MFFQYKMRYLVVSKKKNLCDNGIEKSVTQDHCVSSLGMPRGANW